MPWPHSSPSLSSLAQAPQLADTFRYQRSKEIRWCIPCWPARLPRTKNRGKKIREKMMGDVQNVVPGSVPSLITLPLLNLQTCPTTIPACFQRCSLRPWSWQWTTELSGLCLICPQPNCASQQCQIQLPLFYSVSMTHLLRAFPELPWIESLLLPVCPHRSGM